MGVELDERRREAGDELVAVVLRVGSGSGPVGLGYVDALLQEIVGIILDDDDV